MDNETGNTIRLRAIVEVLGSPKEHVEAALEKYISNIREDKDIMIVKETVSDVSEKEKFWLKFIEMELIIKGLPKLINFCFEFMPSSVEIIKPELFTFKDSEMTGFLNDLQARLHNVDMVVKQLKNENNFIKRNMSVVLQNSLKLILRMKSLDIEQLSKLTGVESKDLKGFIEKMVEENKIKKEGELYSLVEHVTN